MISVLFPDGPECDECCTDAGTDEEDKGPHATSDLAGKEGEEVIDDAGAKDWIGDESESCGCEEGEDIGDDAWLIVCKVVIHKGARKVVDEIEDADAGKHLGDEMREQIFARDGREEDKDKVELCGRVEVDKDVCDAEELIVPEDHPESDAEIAEDEEGGITHGLFVEIRRLQFVVLRCRETT